MGKAPSEINTYFNRKRLDERQVDELVGLCQGIISDGQVSQIEAEFLQKWLLANTHITGNPVISLLYGRIAAVLSDKKLDSDEARELLETLQQFSGGNYELGDILKSGTLPIDIPAPFIKFEEKRFCFTGTFAFGSRADCEAVTKKLNGESGNLTGKTDYLVIGVYATESWKHSAFGRKIEKAVEMKGKGIPIAIIHEPHWVEAMK